MSVCKDLCVYCSKTIRTSHKQISCKTCKLFVHKKCTKLKKQELKKLNVKEWICSNCNTDTHITLETQHDDIEKLNANVNVSDTDLCDFKKYDKMLFNPLRYENLSKESDVTDDIHPKNIDIDCKYVTSEQLCKSISNEEADFTLFNLNIRSANKNLDHLKNCLKSINHNFSIIGLTETQLKDKPNGHLYLPDYNLEYMNRVGRKSGGVCLYEI